MQTIVAGIKALIMLVVAVAVGVAVYFGKETPELLSALWRGNFEACSWQTRPTNNASPNTLPNNRADVNSTAGVTTNPTPNKAPAVSPVAPVFTAGPAPLTLRPAPNARPIEPQQPFSNTPGTANVQQAAYTLPVAAPAAVPAKPAETGDSLAASQQRLRELGARYFKLETAGDGSDRFRCFCQVADPRGGPVQVFTALDREPLTALRDVVRQVETWHTQRQPMPMVAPGQLR